MRLKNLISDITIYIIVMVLILVISQTKILNAQTELISERNSDHMVRDEILSPVMYEERDGIISGLDKAYKQNMESGNTDEAERIKEEIYSIIPEDKIFKLKTNAGEVKITEPPEDPQQNDWSTGNQLVYYGYVNNASGYSKQIDMKKGEDNFIYTTVCYNQNNFNHVTIYRSSDLGNTWNHVHGLGFFGYSSNLSMTIESRANNNPDSTRIIIFFNRSYNYGSYNDAAVYYYSVRCNGTDYKIGQVAAPEPGNKFTGISVVSDGAYYQNATYFGVVCTESDNNTEETKKIKFFRTIDWGATWAGSVISTGYNDRYPSASYKEGSYDSVYIAVERNFDSSLSLIRVISTPWLPSSNFYTYYLNGGVNVRYERPCLNIRQNNPALTAMVTCTKDNIAMYHFTTNAGASWYLDHHINYGNSSKKLFTYCSSSATGEFPYTTCVMTMNGDSINVRKGFPGLLGLPQYKVNSYNSRTNVNPVCEFITKDNKDFSIVAYSSTNSPYPNVYSTQEASKIVNLKVIPQGLYDASGNLITFSDTVTCYLRNYFPPYSIVDSAKSTINPLTYLTRPLFKNTIDGSYFVIIKHRNSIETWSKLPLDFTIPGDKDLDLTQSADNVYGNNEIRVDNSPVRFGIYSGEVNKDGIIDLTDVIKINNDANTFSSGYVISDLTGDFIVDLNDVLLAFNNASAFVNLKRP